MQLLNGVLKLTIIIHNGGGGVRGNIRESPKLEGFMGRTVNIWTKCHANPSSRCFSLDQRAGLLD